MFCSSLLAASALLMSQPAKPVLAHSVQYFDQQLQGNVSNRVLNRTICKDIVRVYPDDADVLQLSGEALKTKQKAVHQQRLAAKRQVELHCKRRMEAENQPINECVMFKD